ncbi:MAG: bifunctional DNA primase/polymerase [Bryobacterales bacterium]|nr:bifunctional DNA primase/polymerase [Bryobacterales bacterium]
MSESNSIYTEAFENYRKMGLDPVPIPYEDGHPTKGPIVPGWQTTAASGGYTEADFAASCNIGILLGGTKNLTDIDCDSPEAVLVGGEIIGHLMETTGKTMMFGRASKPRSHFVFSCDQSLATEKITDPGDHECIIEFRCVNQNGERGQQTVFPPSLRYDSTTGEIESIRLEEDSSPEPVVVEAKKLHRGFRLTAATALLAKHFPVEAERHNTILALAGMFTGSGMPEEKAVEIIRLAYVYSRGYNNDSRKAEADVRSVYKANATRSSTHLYGYPKLTEIMPKAPSVPTLMRQLTR